MGLTNLPVWALQKTKLLKYLNLQVKSKYAGKSYVIPIVNTIGIHHLRHKTEPWMTSLIRKLVGLREGVFLDVGANVGQTLMKVRSLSSVRYIGMEPNPECVLYLKKLIEANKLKGCTICPCGLSNKNGLLTLFSNSAASPYASVIKGFRDHDQWNLTQTQIVPVMRGDDLIKDIGLTENIAVIKIDVEGGELEVIEGLRETLERFRPFIISEILPAHTLEDEIGKFRKERQDKLLKILEEHRYHVFRVANVNQYEPVSQIKVGGDSSHYNYLLSPGEFAANFLEAGKEKSISALA